MVVRASLSREHEKYEREKSLSPFDLKRLYFLSCKVLYLQSLDMHTESLHYTHHFRFFFLVRFVVDLNSFRTLNQVNFHDFKSPVVDNYKPLC